MIKNYSPDKFYEIETLVKTPIDALVKSAEENYHNQIQKIVTDIIGLKNIHFILLAGPSSSGKTTTSHLIKSLFEKSGKHAKVISLDDFFLDRDETPHLPNGDKDFDSVNSIDWKLFDKCMSELLEKKQSRLPVYNFLTGEKNFNAPITTLKENEIIIIEGLHALNPIINNFIPHKYSRKVFVCPKTVFMLNNKTTLDIFNLRLIRRLIRDVRARGIAPQKTLSFWKNVRDAENLYVLPFEKDADYTVNTTHAYEPFVYKSILSTLLINHKADIQHLLDYLEGFLEVEPSVVPDNSVLKEFVG